MKKLIPFAILAAAIGTSRADTTENQNAFTRRENFEYRFDVVEFPESVKVAGVPKYHGGVDDWIGEYHQKYEPLLKDADTIFEPYTVICVWSNLLGEKRKNAWESGDRVWGCLVKSLDNLPEGVSSADIGLKKFLVMTVRAGSWDDLDKVVAFPVDNFKALMPKEYADALYPPIQEVNWHFQIDDETFMSYMEADRDIKTNPKPATQDAPLIIVEAGNEITPAPDAEIFERKYYAPLK